MDVYNIWLSLVMGSNCANAQQIIQQGFSPKDIYVYRKGLGPYAAFTAKQLATALAIKLEQAEEIAQKHWESGIKSINFTDPEYPKRFLNIPKPPLVLYYKGDLSLLDCPYTVGVIGTRHADRDGGIICGNMARGLAQGGAVIVSGLAQGLDSEAHKTCLEAGGKTIAFVGVPLDRFYPAGNRTLQEKIYEQGLVVCEYPVGWAYHSADFLERNRLIAALSDALCIVQAKERSGSLATARMAREYDKPIFAVPGNPLNENYTGTNLLLAKGEARVALDHRVILQEIGLEQDEKSPVKKQIKLDLSPEEKALYSCFDGSPLSTNQLAVMSKMPSSIVKVLLSSLELKGIVEHTGVGLYHKKK